MTFPWPWEPCQGLGVSRASNACRTKSILSYQNSVEVGGLSTIRELIRRSSRSWGDRHPNPGGLSCREAGCRLHIDGIWSRRTSLLPVGPPCNRRKFEDVERMSVSIVIFCIIVYFHRWCCHVTWSRSSPICSRSCEPVAFLQCHSFIYVYDCRLQMWGQRSGLDYGGWGGYGEQKCDLACAFCISTFFNCHSLTFFCLVWIILILAVTSPWQSEQADMTPLFL